MLVVRGDFKSQNIAKTLWAFVTLGLQPREELVGGLQVQAVAVGRLHLPGHCKPAMGICDAKATAQRGAGGGADGAGYGCAGKFYFPEHCQHFVGSMLPQHPLARRGVPTDTCLGAPDQCPCCQSSLDFRAQHQLHQYFVACEVDEAMRAGIPASILAL